MTGRTGIDWLRAFILGMMALGSVCVGQSFEARRLEGEKVEPFAGSAEAVVFLFLGVDCPISNRYAPAINRLVETHADSDIDFWAVYSDPYFTIEEIRKHRKEYDYRMPALEDFKRALSAYCGATVTPEAVVYARCPDDSFRMVYRGRIDNQYIDFGKWRLKATESDLEATLESIRRGGGSELVFRETRAVGCYIGN